MIKQILTSKRGEMYMEVIVTFIVILSLLLFCMSALQVASVRNTGDIICNYLLETATFYGEFGSEFNDAVNAMKEQYPGLEFEVAVDGDWFNSTLQRVQLGDAMTVTITYSVTIRGFGAFLSIPLKSVRTGASENYWKVV